MVWDFILFVCGATVIVITVKLSFGPKTCPATPTTMMIPPQREPCLRLLAFELAAQMARHTIVSVPMMLSGTCTSHTMLRGHRVTDGPNDVVLMIWSACLHDTPLLIVTALHPVGGMELCTLFLSTLSSVEVPTVVLDREDTGSSSASRSTSESMMAEVCSSC